MLLHWPDNGPGAVESLWQDGIVPCLDGHWLPALWLDPHLPLQEVDELGAGVEIGVGLVRHWPDAVGEPNGPVVDPQALNQLGVDRALGNHLDGARRRVDLSLVLVEGCLTDLWVLFKSFLHHWLGLGSERVLPANFRPCIGGTYDLLHPLLDLLF